MRELITPRTLKLLTCVAVSVVLASCSSTPAPKKSAPVARSSDAITSPPGLDINRAHKDGAPWWDVDISKIPDATPTVHTGNYKANPYTVLGQTYYPMQDWRNYREDGIASWYGTKFHGQNTANGEFYDLYGMSAAHKTLPLPAYVRVTNLANGRSVVLRVNDRGPFYSDRIIDLSYAAAKKLGYAESGTARVRVEGIDPVKWWAERGQKPPMVLNQPQVAQTQPIPASTGRVEQWTPPAQQHAAAVVPVQVAGNNVPDGNGGMFLQVGAFANPDAAELLRSKLSTMVSAPVFISSIVRDQQTLHRVRLGPISSRGEVQQMQDSVRLANLGQAKLVTAD